MKCEKKSMLQPLKIHYTRQNISSLPFEVAKDRIHQDLYKNTTDTVVTKLNSLREIFCNVNNRKTRLVLLLFYF